jgi:hypothetical protein
VAVAVVVDVDVVVAVAVGVAVGRGCDVVGRGLGAGLRIEGKSDRATGERESGRAGELWSGHRTHRDP